MENKVVNLKINVDSATAKTELNNIKKGTENIGESSKVLTSKLDAMTGGALSGFKSMTSGLSGIAMGFKGVGAAIAMSGLGLLVIVISAVTAAFKGSEEGQNKFAKIMSVIGVVTGNLIDILANLGEKIIWVFENPKKALTDFGNLLKENIINRFTGMLELFPAIGKAMKLVFQGEFEKAGEVAFNAVSKVATGIENTTSKLKGLVKGTKEYLAEQQREMKLGAQVADMRAKADLIDRKLLVDRAKMESKISDLKLKSREIDKFSAQERSKFLKEATTIEDSLLLREQEALNLRYQAQKTENTFSRTNKENADKEAQAQANLSNIETRRNDNKKATLRELNRVNNEIKGQEKANLAESQKIIDEANKIKTEAEKKSLTDAQAIKTALEQSQETPAQKENREYLEKKLVLEANHLDTELLTKIHNDNLNKIILDSYAKDADAAIVSTAKNKANADAQESIDKKLADSKIANLARGSAMLSNISDLIGKNTAAGKVAAVAAATIDTYAAAQAAFKNAQANPISILGPAYPYISAGLAIAGGLKNVKSILAVKTPNGGGGGGSGPSDRSIGSGPSAPSFNVVGASQTNQLAQSIGQQQNQPIRTYVVSSDVSTAQSLDRNIITSASIG